MVREEEVVRRWSGSWGGGRLTSTSGTGDDDEAPTRPSRGSTRPSAGKKRYYFIEGFDIH